MDAVTHYAGMLGLVLFFALGPGTCIGSCSVMAGGEWPWGIVGALWFLTSLCVIPLFLFK